jgi:hypothetical protein
MEYIGLRVGCIIVSEAAYRKEAQLPVGIGEALARPRPLDVACLLESTLKSVALTNQGASG